MVRHALVWMAMMLVAAIFIVFAGWIVLTVRG